MKNCKERSLAKVAKNKSLLKEYVINSCRKVYLNDNDEFQIYLHNPYDYTIGAEISIDNKMLSNIIVLRPGEKIWLERYLPSHNKFKFSTYIVDDDRETRNAIANNGLISIDFYRERENRFARREIHYYSPSVLPTYTYYTNGTWTEYSKSIDTGLDTGTNHIYCQNTVGDSIKIDSSATNTAATFASTTDYNPNTGITCSATANCASPKSIETGRIEYGSHSDQRFRSEYLDLEFWPFASERIQILPNSTKPIYKNDTVKKYCYECGHKVKERFKFCPFCGARLD